MDQLPRLGKRGLICLLSFACDCVVFVWRGFLFLWVLGMGYVILLWHSLSLPYNYFLSSHFHTKVKIKLNSMNGTCDFVVSYVVFCVPFAFFFFKFRNCFEKL